jgi:hypothetical protein
MTDGYMDELFIKFYLRHVFQVIIERTYQYKSMTDPLLTDPSVDDYILIIEPIII